MFQIYWDAKKEDTKVVDKEAFFAVPMFKLIFMHVRNTPQLDDYLQQKSGIKGDRAGKIEQIKEGFAYLESRYCKQIDQKCLFGTDWLLIVTIVIHIPLN